MAAGRRRATEASRRAPLDDDRPIEGGPILSSVAVGWSDGKPRPVPDDMRRWLKGNPSSPGGDGGSCSPDQRARMPRPRSANAPKPALTVDYSRVARNEVDAFTLGCSQVEQLTLSNAENVRQLEYLAKASEGFIGSAHATAGELRQSRALCPGGPPLSALVASSHGAEKKAAAASMHPARTNRARQEEYGKKGGLRGEGGRAGRSGLTCAVMIVALVVQPVVSQTVRQAADSTSAFEAHGRRAMESGDDMKLECARGNHRTSGDVTTSGDGTCRRPRRAHAVDVNDHFGKLIAPLYTHEFLLESAAGPWGSSPRHISRQDPRYFADFGLSQDHHVHELLRKSCPLSDPGGKKRGMHNLEDVKLVRGRRASRLLVGHHAAAPAAHAANDALSWKDAVSYFDAGFSVFLRHVDLRSAPLSRFVQGLEDELAIPMQAHLQWTPPLSEGGGEHTGHLTDGMGQGPDAPGGGVRRASVEQLERRQHGGDIFLLQVSGRQIVHAYQMPRLQVRLGGHEQVLVPHGSPPESAGVEQEGWLPGRGVARGEQQASVEGMVRGDEIDDRCRSKSTVKRKRAPANEQQKSPRKEHCKPPQSAGRQAHVHIVVAPRRHALLLP